MAAGRVRFGWGAVFTFVLGGGAGWGVAHLMRSSPPATSLAAASSPTTPASPAPVAAPPPSAAAPAAMPSPTTLPPQTLLELRRVRDENRSLRARLDGVLNAQAAGQSPAESDNRALRTELARVRKDLEQSTAMREQSEGKAIPFPKDLPERYKQDALVRTVTEALKAAGLPGEVKSIDCSEYPCMLYGQAQSKDDAAMKAAFRKTMDVLEGHYPGDSNRWSVSRWQDRGKPGEMMFGLAVMPKGEEAKPNPEVTRRMRHRSSQYMDSLRP